MASHTSLIQQAISAYELATSLLNYVRTASSNGALTYALKHNQLSVHQLVGMGEHQAKQLPWVGPKVWAEASHLMELSK